MFSGLEVNRLRQLLITMYRISQESINLLKQQIIALKADAMNENQAIKSQFELLIKSYDDLKTETQNHERELIQRLTVDHELELNDLTKKLFMKDDEISTLKSENEQLESKIKSHEEKFGGEKVQLEKRIGELEEKLHEMEKKIMQQNCEKDAAIKALKDDHRNEIESLRCKFKLITSMDSSPSETSLDKIDTIDITTHETILRQVKATHEEELHNAVKEAIEKERAAAKMSESTLQNQKWSITSPSSPGKQSPKDSQEIFKRILEEKDRQLDQIREREQYLIKESNQLKGIIQSLTDEELNESQVTVYKEKLEHVMSEKRKLEKDLEKEKAKRAKLSNLAQGNGGITINSCSKDDIVFVVWNSVHEQYTIVQDSTILYFLHAESYGDLNLSGAVTNTWPRLCYCIGRVTDKEYCHAKKDENRYKVGKGTKFYRVKVRPRSPSRDMMERSVTERKKIRRSTGENLLLFLQTH